MNERMLCAPFLRTEEHTRARMRDALIALVPLLLAGSFFYGWKVLLSAVCAVAASAVAEVLFSLVFRRKIRLWDVSFAVTGLVSALLLPADAPFWAAAVAAAVGALCKGCFGGIGRNWVNPALLGAVTCYAVGLAVPSGPMGALLVGKMVAIGPVQLLIGAPAGGAVGACSPMLVLLSYGYLAARGLVRPAFSLSFLLVLLAGSVFLLPGGPLHLFCAGEALFLLLLCGSDSVTTPMLLRSQLILGLLGGAAAVALRLTGIEGTALALLLCGPAARGLDAFFLRKA